MEASSERQSQGKNKAEEVSYPTPVDAGSGRISAAAARAWRAARILGDGGQKLAGGKGEEDRGRAVNKKGHTMDLIIFPHPVTSVYFFSPPAQHFSPSSSSASKRVRWSRGGAAMD